MSGERRERPRQRSLHCPPEEQEMIRARAKVLFLGLLWRGFPVLFGLNRDGFSRVRLF